MTDPKESKKQKQAKRINEYAKYSGIAFQMLAIISIGSYGGMKLDELYPNKQSWFTISLSLVSVAIAMYFVIRQVGNNTKKKDE